MIRALAVSFLLALPVTLLVSGCGSNAAAPEDAGSTIFASCVTDMTVPKYEDGMQVMSESVPAVFTIKLTESRPGPPIKGENTWTIEVDEVATGLPLDGLDISVEPFMPAHKHGTAPVTVAPMPDEPGKYSLDPVYLFMSGVWEVKFIIVGTMVQGGKVDSAMIPICIP